MIKIYRSDAAGLHTLSQPEPGSWIDVTNPTPDEITHAAEILGVSRDFLTDPLDENERARVDRVEQATLIVLRVPAFRGAHAPAPYTTMPFGIILTEHVIATVCLAPSEVIPELVAEHTRGPLSTAKHNRFVLWLLLASANRFLRDLREIDHAVDALEQRLQHSLQNRELLELLKYQKSLVYFTTALKANALILQHLQKSQMFEAFPQDAGLLEDVEVEIQQAIEMTDISGNILSQMMDAFASIISNNLNVVMKFLASVTIIVSLPTLIASLYGMNVDLPADEAPWAFAAILAVSLISTATVGFVFWRRNWL